MTARTPRSPLKHHTSHPPEQAVSALGIEVCSWEEALAAGAEAPVEPVPPSPDDYCTIMYTSGTTGESSSN